MDFLFRIAQAATTGAIIGVFLGYIKNARKKPRTAELTPKQKENMRKVSLLVGSLTFVVLGIGLIWTVYYLILGAVDPAYSDYATNMSQLIVSVLTVFSIIIAFYQFLREKPQLPRPAQGGIAHEKSSMPPFEGTCCFGCLSYPRPLFSNSSARCGSCSAWANISWAA